ncbi:hypothetical protein PHLGIDRAFT_117121 [Phlebiopsis gigantea 11061_1 CR5-6]|uniref:Arrestin-like N-terminal domain-containing protein n=1 Tax=Phlebiopsis gigantea (strain 11061_1 CR5-6) TaxID=745531 RepID=A0A0C3SC87_PHLG1|nr:hypothetical protein PHLGIDRAFT_117121 [Phlebiopsis gigantea 11061_1 CR5-6]
MACVASTSSLPPSYSPSSAPSPPYTCCPSIEEQRLYYVARPSSNEAPEGVFTVTARGVSVTLNHQEDGTDTPVYTRRGLVSGEIRLEDDHAVAVTVQLEGHQKMSVTELAPVTLVLFSQKHTLWKRQKQEACPKTIDFRLPFPTTYPLNGADHELPSTFVAHFPDSPGLYAEIAYTLTVKISRPRLGTWKQHTNITIPVKYQPRSRPFLPISPDLYPFLSTVKAAPEAWHQVTSVILPGEDDVGPIDCHLFIPSVQIYGLTDTVPFHLQLRGPSNSLSALVGLSVGARSMSLPPLAKLRSRTRLGKRAATPPPQRTRICDHAAQYPWSLQSPYVFVASMPGDLRSLGSARSREPARTALAVRVYVLRQVATKVKGQRAWRNRVLAEGTLRAVGEPPCFGASTGSETVPSFIAGELQVKDFVVVQVSPPASPLFEEHQFSHSIRLVTDTYREVAEHPANQ